MLKPALSITLLLSSTLSAFAAAEGFEKLKPIPEAMQNQLKAANWTYDTSSGLPYGWYVTPFHKNGAIKTVTDSVQSGKQALFLRGAVMMDSTLFKRNPGDDLAGMTFQAKADKPNSTAIFYLNFQGAKGEFLGSISKSVKLSPEWKEYTIKIDVPEEHKGKKIIRIAPSLGSPEGAYFDEVDFFSTDKASDASLAAGSGEQASRIIMDFDFTNIGGKEPFQDKTGQYTLFTDCGDFLNEHNALRVAFGARLRIPCENDAFTERFTINTWILKSENLGRDFRSPILSRGFMQPYAGSMPGPEDFDFMFDLNSFIPGFYTATGGLKTTGVPYNRDFRYLNSSEEKRPASELFQMDRWQNLTVTYDQGKIKAYINGELSAETTQSARQALLQCNQPLYIGAARVKNEIDNQIASEMLIKNLTIQSGVLTASEIKNLYQQTRATLPDTNRLRLEATRNYYSPEMLPNDPEMTRRLARTQEFLNKSKTDPFAQNQSMTGRYVRQNGKINLEINGVPQAPITANPHSYDKNEHRYTEFVADFAAAGVNFTRVGVLVDDYWLGVDQYDWSKLDKRIQSFIDTNPGTMMTISFGVTPPQWFYKQYPEELEEYYFNLNDPNPQLKKWTGHGGPMGSEKWLQMSVKMVADFVKHIEASSYNNHIYGYALSGGDAGEWYWPGQFAGLTGYSKPTLESFKNFLRKKYNNDPILLQKSWNDPQITFDTVTTPTPAERNASENSLFRDLEKAAKATDFRRFINDQTMRNFNESCRAIRENAAENKIITTYYGYPMYYAGRGVLHVSGLQTTSDVFKSPWIDAIATPIDYLKRRGGEPGINIAGFNGTAKLYNKMIWREEDLRTHLYPRLEFGRTATLRETIEVIRRGFAYTIADNYGMWFVCQAGHHAYHQDEMMDDIAKMKKIADDSMSQPRTDIAEVALIFDEKESLTQLSAGASEFLIDHMWGTYQNAHQMGAPFNLYFLDDLANPDMRDYKLYIFVNPYSINAEQKAMIDRKVKKNQAVVVWNYAPGYLHNGKFDLDNMKALTGFEFTEERLKRTVSAQKTSIPSPITANATDSKKYFFGPVFNVSADSATILASDGATNTLAQKEYPEWKSVYSMLPLTPELLNGLCNYAGVHVYSNSGDTLLANGSYIALHAKTAGKKTIRLPKKAHVTELISSHDYGTTDRIEDEISQPWTTRIYQLQ